MLKNGKIYQDIWINGRVVLPAGLYDKDGYKTEFGPECNDRYKIIKKHLPKDERLYVVDIGACYGYFGIRIAEDFANAQVMMIEELEVDFLRLLVKENNVDAQVVVDPSLDFWLEQGIGANELKHRHCVLLLLNVLHHLPQWREVLTKASQFHRVFIMHPPDEDKGSEHMVRVRAINKELAKFDDMKEIGTFPSHRTTGTYRKLMMWRPKPLKITAEPEPIEEELVEDD